MEDISKFQHKILDWYDKNQRDLPWRKTRDPYAILVSEVMSQQTQINRVMEKYEQWMDLFPTLRDLADAKTSDILTMWSGLGYNRRALYLQKAAKIIKETYHGEFPKYGIELLQLPGIGEYTASAIRCFAFNEQIAVIDTNVRKVISIHFFNGISPSKAALKDFATKLLPPQKAYEWNQALMDYAAMELHEYKISIPKQSKFIGSNRYYRGSMVKMLVANKKLSIHFLQKHFEKEISLDRINEVINSLVKDQLVEYEEGVLKLKD